MSIISLTIAPLLEKHNEDWDVWYYGLIPLGVMIVGTFLVYQMFWASTPDITAAPAVKDVEGGAQEPASAPQATDEGDKQEVEATA